MNILIVDDEKDRISIILDDLKDIKGLVIKCESSPFDGATKVDSDGRTRWHVLAHRKPVASPEKNQNNHHQLGRRSRIRRLRKRGC